MAANYWNNVGNFARQGRISDFLATLKIQIRTNKELSVMQYLEFTFTTAPANEAVQDVLAAVLAEIGFDSFVHTDELDRAAKERTADPEAPVLEDKAAEDHFRCYIQKALFDRDALDTALREFPLPDVEINYEMVEAEDKDWNEEWEKNYFKPLVVDGRCVIASTFHENVPQAEYRITINPQMSFGTGHHATTSQMISRLLNDDITGKEVLDMGCGTSILAILARMRGAAHCLGIDVDEWCVKNSRENIALNRLDGIDVELGNAESLAGRGPFDLVIANINLGILVNDLKHYVACMKPGAYIYMSGFYDSDIPTLMQEATAQGLTLVDEHVLDGWACIKLQKLQ